MQWEEGLSQRNHKWEAGWNELDFSSAVNLSLSIDWACEACARISPNKAEWAIKPETPFWHISRLSDTPLFFKGLKVRDTVTVFTAFTSANSITSPILARQAGALASSIRLSGDLSYICQEREEPLQLLGSYVQNQRVRLDVKKKKLSVKYNTYL